MVTYNTINLPAFIDSKYPTMKQVSHNLEQKFGLFRHLVKNQHLETDFDQSIRLLETPSTFSQRIKAFFGFGNRGLFSLGRTIDQISFRALKDLDVENLKSKTLDSLDVNQQRAYHAAIYIINWRNHEVRRLAQNRVKLWLIIIVFIHIVWNYKQVRETLNESKKLAQIYSRKSNINLLALQKVFIAEDTNEEVYLQYHEDGQTLSKMNKVDKQITEEAKFTVSGDKLVILPLKDKNSKYEVNDFFKMIFKGIMQSRKLPQIVFRESGGNLPQENGQEYDLSPAPSRTSFHVVGDELDGIIWKVVSIEKIVPRFDHDYVSIDKITDYIEESSR